MQEIVVWDISVSRHSIQKSFGALVRSIDIREAIVLFNLVRLSTLPRLQRKCVTC